MNAQDSLATHHLVRGRPGLALLADEAFLSRWRTLHSQCPHATVFQAPAFVRSWYYAYQSQWQPVIVHSTALNGELTGLWLLAYDAEQQILTHAGSNQAEYHVWLALPGEDAAFLAAAWAKLQRLVAFEALQFKYLPSAKLVDTLRIVPGLDGLLAMKIHARPLIRLHQESIKKSLAKPGNRSRLNRLKRLGTLSFKRLADPVELEQVFEKLIAYYDFRQEAVNHVAPFREDPLKRLFHRLLFASAPEETHVTVTSLAGEAIAAFWGMASDKTVHLGMLIHSPLLAEHSPGKLHLMLLQDELLKEGKEILDLTPGGDPWKENFADSHDEVAEVTIHRSAWRRKQVALFEKSLKVAKRCFGRLGITPMHLRQVLAGLRPGRLPVLLRKAREWVYSYGELRFYRVDRAAGNSFIHDGRILLNSLQDLLSFEPGKGRQPRHEFLYSALGRLGRGESIYSRSIDNRLAHWGWMVRKPTEVYLTEVQQSVVLPPGTALLYHFHFHPDFQDRCLTSAMIGHLLHEAFMDDSIQCAYIALPADAQPFHCPVESQASYEGLLCMKRRFGSLTKRATLDFSDLAGSCEKSGPYPGGWCLSETYVIAPEAAEGARPRLGRASS